MTHPETAIQT